MKGQQLVQINLIKAFAIISVIVVHTPKIASTLPYPVFYVSQAVPVFIILMGLNSSLSSQWKSIISLKQGYSKEYLYSRFIMIVVPFLFVYSISLAIGFFL